MLQALIQLALFAAKAIIIVLVILCILIIFFALLAKGKEKTKGKLTIKNLNHEYDDVKLSLLSETLSKKELKKYLKDQKQKEKQEVKSEKKFNNIFVLNFQGDIKASAVASLTKEITAILNVASPADQVLLRLESGGGVVHGYGLAAAQLMRLRAANIPLTIAIDKVAASGGYMMAAVANKILAAPFAIIGSIGVVVQLPNFNRLLKDKNIDYELHTAGEFKRTITLFGENTEEGREKLQEEIEDIHGLFKNLIHTHRPTIDIQQVATGEHWLAQQALGLNLVDEIKTSDDYLFEQSQNHEIRLFEVSYETKKPLLSRLAGAGSLLLEKIHFMT